MKQLRCLYALHHRREAQQWISINISGLKSSPSSVLPLSQYQKSFHKVAKSKLRWKKNDKWSVIFFVVARLEQWVTPLVGTFQTLRFRSLSSIKGLSKRVSFVMEIWRHWFGNQNSISSCQNHLQLYKKIAALLRWKSCWNLRWNPSSL